MKTSGRRIYFLFMLFIFSLSAEAQVASYLIAKGDTAYQNFDNQAALAYYAEAIKSDSNNYEAAWKLSRAYVDVGEALEDKELRKQYYQKGEEFARKAVAIDSNGAKGHLFLSVAIGRVALDAGKKEQVRLSKEIKKEVDKALELDPNEDIAWHVLGRWNRKMATLGWIQRKFANLFLGGVPKDASVERAAECFEKAIEIDPDHINHHLELGLTYEELDQKEKAVAQYQQVLSLEKRDADDEKYKQQARERLEDIQ